MKINVFYILIILFSTVTSDIAGQSQISNTPSCTKIIYTKPSLEGISKVILFRDQICFAALYDGRNNFPGYHQKVNGQWRMVRLTNFGSAFWYHEAFIDNNNNVHIIGELGDELHYFVVNHQGTQVRYIGQISSGITNLCRAKLTNNVIEH
jgi:hypothetical protein